MYMCIMRTLDKDPNALNGKQYNRAPRSEKGLVACRDTTLGVSCF